VFRKRFGSLNVQHSRKRFAYLTESDGRFEERVSLQYRRASASPRRALASLGIWISSALLPVAAHADQQVLLEEQLSPSVYQGGIALLSFTMTNKGTGIPTGITWSDDLAPLGLQVVQCPGAHGASCTGAASGTITGLTLGSTLIGTNDYSLENTCTFTACVSASIVGTQVNTTSAVTSNNGFSGAAATASIDVLPDQPP